MGIQNEPIQIEREISEQIIRNIGLATERETNETFLYNNGVFKESDIALATIREQINQISSNTFIPIKEGVRPYKLSISKRNLIIELVKTSTFVSINDFDIEENRINCKNGHLIRKDGEMTFWDHFKHNENPYKSKIQIPVNYDPEAESVEINQIFREVFGSEVVPLIYEMIAYMILPHTKYSKAFMFYGETGTGKTTAINIITQFIGQNNISGIELQSLNDKFELEKTRNKLVNIFDDLSSRPIKYVANFKKLVTDSYLYGRIKFLQKEIGWKNKCKGLFACNQLPKIEEYITDAFYTRWVLIPCFTDMKELGIRDSKIREKKYPDKEMSGLLNKVLEAMKRLEEREAFPEVWQDIDFVRHRWNMDINPVALFVEKCCYEGESLEVEYEQFFKYVNAFRKEERCDEINKRSMTIALKKLGIEKADKGSKLGKEKRYVFKGIDFKDDYIMDHLELQKEEPKPTITNYINGEY